MYTQSGAERHSAVHCSCSCLAKESVGDTVNHQDDVFDVFLAQEYQAKAEGENGEPFTDNVSGAEGGPERHGHLAQRNAERYREALSDNEPVHEELRERASRRTTELMGAEEKVVAKRMIVDNDGEEAEKGEEFQPAPWTIAAIAWVDTEPLVGYHDNDVNSSDIPCVEYKDGKYHSECADRGADQRRARAAERDAAATRTLQLGQCKGGMPSGAGAGA